MAKIIGRTSVVGIGLEGTKGTSVAPSYWVPIENIDFDDKVDYIDNMSGLGQIAEMNDAKVNRLYAEGSIEGKIFLDSIGEELAAVLGADPTSGQRATSGVYDHSYALQNDNNHNALTIAYEDANQDLRFTYAMVNTWGLEISLDNFVRRTASFISKKSASASNSASFTDENEFIPSHVYFRLDDVADQDLDNASDIAIRSFSMEINKNAEALYVLGDNEPNAIVNKQINVTGSIELYMDNTTYRAFALGGTQKAIRIGMKDESTDLGSGHNPELYFDLHKVSFKSFERGFDPNEIMLQTLEFEAQFDIGEDGFISARLTNTETAYGA